MTIVYGDELVQIVEIRQPLCGLSYGNSPCQAALGVTGENKCFNTRVSCQDGENYDPETLVLRFSREQEGIQQYGYVIPSIQDLSITPLSINICSMERDQSPFGQREVASIVFNDHAHSDLLVDPYRLERSYIPISSGTFWGKWLARNPYHEGYEVIIYDGKMGDALEDMSKRHYYIDKITGPSNGRVTISCKDIFTKVEARKAVAPTASRGELSANISNSATSLTLLPSGIGDLDYGTSGYVCIGNEVMSYTRSLGSDTLSVTRGQLNTVAAAHEQEDKVQVVLAIVAQEAHNIVYDLLTTYGGVDPSNIPFSDWETEAEAHFANLYTTYVVEPTPIQDLIGELGEQAGFSVWPDVGENMIRMKAIIPDAGQLDPVVTDNEWIKEGTITITRKPDTRVSQVWIYYGKVDPTKKKDEKTNYRSRAITVDPDAEGPNEWGTPSVKEIFSRWIPQFGRAAALQVGERIISIYRDPPYKADFTLHSSREGELALARPFVLQTAEVQNFLGEDKQEVHIPIQLHRLEDTIRVRSQLLRFNASVSTSRDLFIDNSTRDFNIRTEHDLLYGEPSFGDVVRVFIDSDAVVGATIPNLTIHPDAGGDYYRSGASVPSPPPPAFQTGTWPDGVDIQIYIYGRIAGAGGDGGWGEFGSGGGSRRNGIKGGTAMVLEYPVKIYNGGVIAGGGGGGGGGGAGSPSLGGAAGGGAGDMGGCGGIGGTSSGEFDSVGHIGTLLAGGAGDKLYASSGLGGNGGAPGEAGQNGQAGSSSAGGLGGEAGWAIVNGSNVTWIDEDGNATTVMGTILGDING